MIWINFIICSRWARDSYLFYMGVITVNRNTYIVNRNTRKNNCNYTTNDKSR